MHGSEIFERVRVAQVLFAEGGDKRPNLSDCS